MEFVITGRNVAVSDRFKKYTGEKVGKVQQLGDKVVRLDAKLSKESKPRLAEHAHRVELTVIGKGPVVRAEAAAVDKYSAFDIAFGKLIERLRRASDRRKIHRGNHRPVSVAEATSEYVDFSKETSVADVFVDVEAEQLERQTPISIRRKVFVGEKMSLEDAIDRMELVGHDFYLFVDVESGLPSVAYRRRAWTYGVISLADGGVEELEEVISGYRS